MANEMNLNFSMAVSKGSVVEISQASFSADVSADPAKKQTVPFSATDTAANLSFSGLTTPRWGLIKNTGDTNDLVLGVDASGFVEVMRIPPGMALPVRIGSSVTLQVKCDSTETTTGMAEVYDA